MEFQTYQAELIKEGTTPLKAKVAARETETLDRPQARYTRPGYLLEPVRRSIELKIWDQSMIDLINDDIRSFHDSRRTPVIKYTLILKSEGSTNTFREVIMCRRSSFTRQSHEDYEAYYTQLEVKLNQPEFMRRHNENLGATK